MEGNSEIMFIKYIHETFIQYIYDKNNKFINRNGNSGQWMRLSSPSVECRN